MKNYKSYSDCDILMFMYPSMVKSLCQIRWICQNMLKIIFQLSGRRFINCINQFLMQLVHFFHSVLLKDSISWEQEVLMRVQAVFAINRYFITENKQIFINMWKPVRAKDLVHNLSSTSCIWSLGKTTLCNQMVPLKFQVRRKKGLQTAVLRVSMTEIIDERADIFFRIERACRMVLCPKWFEYIALKGFSLLDSMLQILNFERNPRSERVHS